MSQAKHSDNGQMALNSGAAYIEYVPGKPVYLMGDKELAKFVNLVNRKRAGEEFRRQLDNLLSGVAA